MRLPPWSLPRAGNGGGQRQFVTPGHPSDPGGNLGKRVRLTRKTRPSASSHVIPDQGHPTPRRWKRMPFLRITGEVRWASLAIFFLDLGLGEVCSGDAWNLPSEGTGVGVFPAGQSSRRGWCAGTSPFNSLHACARMDRHSCVTPRPHNHHNYHTSCLPVAFPKCDIFVNDGFSGRHA